MSTLTVDVIKVGDELQTSGGKPLVPWVYLTEGLISSNTSSFIIDIESYQADFDVLLWSWRDLTMTTNNANMQWQFSNDSGSTFTNTGYYRANRQNQSNNSFANQYSNNNTDVQVSTGVGNSSGNAAFGRTELYNWNDRAGSGASRVYGYYWSVGDNGTAHVSRHGAFSCGAHAGTVDQIKVRTSAGNIDNLSWTLYGGVR